ncbi:beta-galactosidase-like isoform X2 [Hypanus sabinus]|uniref:beta-galactosidase-like isoform X2 n=1 Tax=Hypanus sabinus TaxID=79690 RepID=UPI0028C3BC9E|nr:beta-galactosidase-like isoform X2 [Hypanus sabinus]
MGPNVWILLVFLAPVSGELSSSKPGTFMIDYEKNCFSKDGSCFQYISGSIHYFRVPPIYWKDRLRKMYMAGLNAIQMYVAWNYHEMTPGVFNFTESRDIESFIRLAQETGLLVILRPGPYICAEWDLGGLPAWLLQDPAISLRSSDEKYLAAVDRWFGVLLPKVKPFLYQNGGPIISVQVENEYGSYFTCDYDYLRHLRNIIRTLLGSDILLFTTDGNRPAELRCGTLQGLYATIDFGTNEDVTTSFEVQRQFEPSGPLVNSEFYVGWLDYWGVEHSVVPTANATRMLRQLLGLGANVNMYMFEGGTNFGFWNGADYNIRYRSITTSYDYDAPLSEAGDPREKLHAIRAVISEFRDVPVGPIPPPTPKIAYGQLALTKVGSVLELLSVLSPRGATNSTYPLTFEEMGQYFGLMLYRTLLPRAVEKPAPLKAPLNAVHDRAYVLLSGVYQGLLERDTALELDIMGSEGDVLDIMVENMGRVNFGPCLLDRKGLVRNLSLANTDLTGWSIFPLAIDDAIAAGWIHSAAEVAPGETLAPLPSSPSPQGPTFFSGTFSSPNPLDTYIRLEHWNKGLVWINGFNVGRYWTTRGPQQTLFVPKSCLSEHSPNNVMVLELEQLPAKPMVEFLDHSILLPRT